MIILSLAGVAGAILEPPSGYIFLQLCIPATVAFWGVAAVIWFRRPCAPTKLDLLIIEAGTLPLCVVSFFLSYWI